MVQKENFKTKVDNVLSDSTVKIFLLLLTVCIGFPLWGKSEPPDESLILLHDKKCLIYIMTNNDDGVIRPTSEKDRIYLHVADLLKEKGYQKTQSRQHSSLTGKRRQARLKQRYGYQESSYNAPIVFDLYLLWNFGTFHRWTWTVPVNVSLTLSYNGSKLPKELSSIELHQDSESRIMDINYDVELELLEATVERMPSCKKIKEVWESQMSEQQPINS